MRSERFIGRDPFDGSAGVAAYVSWKKSSAVREVEHPAQAEGCADMPAAVGLEEYRRGWMWGGAGAGGGALTWLYWRKTAERSGIALSSPEGQVRLRTAP